MRSERFFTWWPLVLATAMPLGVNLMCGIPRLALGNFTDAVFYLSYARQFSELALRHGFLYYATRFGGILPDAIAGHLFGENAGIWVLRWVLSGLVSLSLFLAFRKRYGVISGLLASALWSLNPAVQRLACTTYVDSTSVPFLILGCCLVAARPVGMIFPLVAGVFFGLASSAHLYAAFALVLLIPWMVGALWNEGNEEPRSAWRSAGVTALGFFGTWLLGWLWYSLVWGMPGLLSPTIDLMRDLGNGQAALWKKPLGSALYEAPAWFAPVVLLPVVLVVARRGGPQARGAAVALLLGTVFFWGGDLFGKAYVLSMPFYYSFLLPISLLAGADLCGEVLRRQSSSGGRLSACFLMGAAVLIPVAAAGWGVPGRVLAVAFAFLTAALVACRKSLSDPMTTGAAAASLFLSFLLLGSTGMFRQFLGHYGRDDVPVLEAAAALDRLIPSASADQETTRFWYDDDPSSPGGADRRMIGAFHLHYFGKLTAANGGYVPFGVISVEDGGDLRDNGPGRIIVFDQDPERVDAAVRSMEVAKLPYRVANRATLAAGAPPSTRGLSVAVMERSLTMPAGKPVGGFPWHVMHRGHPVSAPGEQSEFLSGKIKWWDPFAEADLGALRKGDRITVPYRILSGRVRFSLGEKGREPVLSVEKWPSGQESVLVMTAPCDMNGAVVSLRNRYPSGSASRIRVGAATMNRSATLP